MMFLETFYIKPIFGTAVIGLMCLCTSTVHQQAAHQKPTPNTPSSQVKTTTPLQSSLPLTERDSSIPLYLPPSQWQGENFIVLPKQKLVRSLGYQLLSCKNEECDSLPIEPSWELNNRRIRCENIAGDPLYVENVEADGNEWIISFFHKKSNRYIYGKTHKQAISEIAYVDDRVNAYNRWIDKIIYSKRGVISTFGTNSTTSITSLRINIQDTLTVTDVVWGRTPLPVKPLWIMVETLSGQSGFIPIRYSWTNAMEDMITEEEPWKEDIFERNPASIFDWDENMWETINNHRVILEMTTDQVLLSWGKPLTITTQDSGQTPMEIWNYPSHTCTFSQKRLITINAVSPSVPNTH